MIGSQKSGGKPRAYDGDKEETVEGFESALDRGNEFFQDITVVVTERRGTPLYFLDVLRYEGIFHDVASQDVFFNQTDWSKIVILVGPMKITRADEKRLMAHVESGGGVITIGLIEPAEDLLGIIVRYPILGFPVGGTKYNSVGEGYLSIIDPALKTGINPDWLPLHGFGCAAIMNDDCEDLAMYETVHESDENWSAITLKRTGDGIALNFGVDVVRTIRHVQEGTYIDQDGIPPPDAMSPIDDGILKAEDGLVLDWTRDRRVISPSQKVPAFMVPVADAWRKLLVRCIEIVADHCQAPIRRVWYWPNGAEFITLLSHDTDGNDGKLAETLLQEINKHGIQTTWCIIPPGYKKELCRKIELFGHELAMHFDAMGYPDNKGKDLVEASDLFSYEMLYEQYQLVKENTGCKSFYSNKNHYTRWEGRTKFFDWCELMEFKVDQSKGPSKCGTTGFPFGSAHPWQPMDCDGHLIDCLEISFQCQDLGLQGPSDIGPELLEAVKNVNGVAHLIFHPAHSEKPEVNKLMHEFINKAKELGASFMTSKEIGEWVFNKKEMVENATPKIDGAVIHVRDTTKQEWKRQDN